MSKIQILMNVSHLAYDHATIMVSVSNLTPVNVNMVTRENIARLVSGIAYEFSDFDV
jgi:hypothetical protein